MQLFIILVKKLIGKILYHAISDLHNDYFIYSMLAVKSALISIIERIVKKNNYKKTTKFIKKKQFRTLQKKILMKK